MSRMRNSAHKSIKPFDAGVPVSPTIRLTFGRTFSIALNRFVPWFLKDDSSSITTMSKSNGTPLSSMSHWTFSRLMV